MDRPLSIKGFRLATAAILGLVAALVIAGHVFALPGQPLRLWGSVIIPVQGAAVVIQTSGVACPKAVAADGGHYVVNVPGDDNDTVVKEGGSTGDIITVFIDPSEPLTVVFPEAGGIRELPIVVSTNDYLAIELQSFQAQKALTVTGAVKDGRTSSNLTGASVVVAWGGCRSVIIIDQDAFGDTRGTHALARP